MAPSPIDSLLQRFRKDAAELGPEPVALAGGPEPPKPEPPAPPAAAVTSIASVVVESANNTVAEVTEEPLGEKIMHEISDKTHGKQLF